MNKKNILKTRALNLCLSCEICSAVCPEAAISFEYTHGQFLPIIDEDGCTNCQLCLDVCPGMDIDPFNINLSRFNINDLSGVCLKSYIGYAKDSYIRKIATSGGVITCLVNELIEKKEYDYAFMLAFKNFKNQPVRLSKVSETKDIIKSSKSKYLPASVYNVIKTLSERYNKKYIIIGTSCQIRGIKKYLKEKRISEKNLLFFGLFCDRTLNFNFIQYIKDVYGKKNEDLVKFEYRTKEKYGWPGNSLAYFNTGRKILINKMVRMSLKKYFQLERCLYCYDKLNRLADISFGDCFIKGEEDFYGKSSIIIRTNKGKETFRQFSDVLKLKKESIEVIRKSQNLSEKKENIKFLKIFLNKNIDYFFNDSFIIKKEITKKFHKLNKNLKLGRDYNLRKIKFHLFISEIINSIKIRIRTIDLLLRIAKNILKDFLSYIFFKYKMNFEKSNIIIMGGELLNKGAQAMTFTVVNELKKRFPEKKIYLFSKLDSLKHEKDIYNFNIVYWSKYIKYLIFDFPNKKINYKSTQILKILKILLNSQFIINISGYQFSSQWGVWPSFQYLLNIMIAKKFSIPYYILPQSIGPFKYHPIYKIILYPLMFKYLKYPKKIYPREEDGVKCLSIFTKKNVKKSFDLVLLNKFIRLSNIYKSVPNFKQITIEKNSVGFIPNLRVLERSSKEMKYNFYEKLILILLESNKIIYLVRHAYEDIKIIENLKKRFNNNSNVRVIKEDLSFFELERIIRQFQFVIASRYHSIITSYKNGIPVIAIGWATKYHELLKNFDQLDYYFDIRFQLNLDKISNAIYKMIKDWKVESQKISKCMNKIMKYNIFNNLFNNEIKVNQYS